MYVQQRDEYLESVCEMAIRKVSIITIFGSLTNSTMKIDHYQLGKLLPHAVLACKFISLSTLDDLQFSQSSAVTYPKLPSGRTNTSFAGLSLIFAADESCSHAEYLFIQRFSERLTHFNPSAKRAAGSFLSIPCSLPSLLSL